MLVGVVRAGLGVNLRWRGILCGNWGSRTKGHGGTGAAKVWQKPGVRRVVICCLAIRLCDSRIAKQNQKSKKKNIGLRPNDVPSHPDKAYKESWLSWKDWLGTSCGQRPRATKQVDHWIYALRVC